MKKFILLIPLILFILGSNVYAEAYFGKNPNNYDKPIQYLDSEMQKEKMKLSELKRKEKERNSRIKSAETDILDKYQETAENALEGLWEYAKGDKSDAAVKYIEGVKAYVEAKDREFQRYKDSTSSFKPQIKKSNKRLENVGWTKKIVEGGQEAAEISLAKENEAKIKLQKEREAKAAAKKIAIAKENKAKKEAAWQKKIIEKEAREAAERERLLEREYLDKMEQHRQEIKRFKEEGGNFRAPF